MKGAITKFFGSSNVQHLLFWILSVYGIGSYFSISNELKFIDFIYAGFFHIPLIILVYVNIRYAIPSLLEKQKYLPYLIVSFFNLATAYFLHQLVFDILVPLLSTDFYMVSFTETSLLLGIFTAYLGLTTLLKLSKSWVQLQRVEKEKLSLELNSLKMQINPHFLFNSLNSMYSLARQKSEKTPDVILQLSQLMRYMIYEVGDEKVALEKEVSAIRDYMALQMLRHESETDIQLRIEVENDSQEIAPLLFFPLIENAFKHGLKDSPEKNYVHIDLVSNNSSLSFRIKNNVGETEDVEGNKYGGIGLENVKKRLNLIYGSDANFQINQKSDSFEVQINITW